MYLNTAQLSPNNSRITPASVGSLVGSAAESETKPLSPSVAPTSSTKEPKAVASRKRSRGDKSAATVPKVCDFLSSEGEGGNGGGGCREKEGKGKGRRKTERETEGEILTECCEI
jgi:hypothetical protein